MENKVVQESVIFFFFFLKVKNSFPLLPDVTPQGDGSQSCKALVSPSVVGFLVPKIKDELFPEHVC